MILILTERSDPHAAHVEQKLRACGAEVVNFDPSQFPSAASVSFAHSSFEEGRYVLQVQGKLIDLGQLDSVWYRRPSRPIAHADLTDQRTRDLVEGESHTFLEDVWNSLECLWLPAPRPVIQRAQMKASQLKIATAIGFEIPPTLVTNDPRDLLEFYRQHNGHIISKLAGTSFFTHVGDSYCRYTEVVSKRDISYAYAVRYCPIIFQAYIAKRVELRITIVGSEVFAAEIHSQQSNHTRHDWRRYDNYGTPHRVHHLPRDVERRCVQLVQRLGLCYGAIDMVLTPDGRYIFLEINPNGQYLWIEDITHLPISDAICSVLLSGVSTRRSAAPKPALTQGEWR